MWDLGEVPIIAAMGSNRSSKSFTGGSVFCKMLRDDAKPGTEYWVVSPNSELSTNSAQKLLWHFLPRSMMGRFSWNEKNGFGSKKPLVILDERTDTNPTGRHITIHFKTQSQYDDDKNSFEAVTIEDAWVDESVSVQCFAAVRSRMATSENGRTLITTIPNAEWMYEAIHETEDPDNVYLQEFFLEDNPVMTPEKIARFEATIPEEERAMRVEGKYNFLSGVVYNNFVREPYPDGHLIARSQIPTDIKYFAGLDVGMDHPTVWVLLGIDKNETIYVVDEYRARHSKVSDDVVAIKAILGDKELEYPTVIDPAAYAVTKASPQAVALQYVNEGLPLLRGLRTASKGEWFGVHKIKALLTDRRLVVCKELKGLLREFALWRYKRDKNNLPYQSDSFEDRNNDGLDALRYILTFNPMYTPERAACSRR